MLRRMRDCSFAVAQAKANRGILYVDEVNLLDDGLVDVVLDSAASGLNTVEREGVSIIHPAKFIMLGSGNPQVCCISLLHPLYCAIGHISNHTGCLRLHTGCLRLHTGCLSNCISLLVINLAICCLLCCRFSVAQQSTCVWLTLRLGTRHVCHTWLPYCSRYGHCSIQWNHNT